MDGEIGFPGCLSFNGITSFNPDQVASTVHTLMSTSPFFKAVALTVSSVISVATFEAFVLREIGEQIKIICRLLNQPYSEAFFDTQLLSERCT